MTQLGDKLVFVGDMDTAASDRYHGEVIVRSKQPLHVASGEGKWSLGTSRSIQRGLVDKGTWSQRRAHGRREIIFQMLCISALNCVPFPNPFLPYVPNLVEW
jgi:hypothetical protein